MGAFSGPSTVTDGLILDLDISNRKSSMRYTSSSLIGTTSWVAGQTGGVSIYGQNGDTIENARVSDTDPWGNTSVVWETRASGNGNADGGWNTNYFAIDRSKLYRFSVWVRRTSTTSGGTFYFGTNSDGGVYSTQDGTLKGNPYWECSNVGILTQNQWYLVCGFIYPEGTTYTGNHPDSGYYIPGSITKVRTLNYCNIVSDLKWGTTSTSVQHRCYHFYCGDSTTKLQFADPRIELCDNTAPSIYELVNNGATLLMDSSNYKNHHQLYNGFIPTANNPSRFQLTGSAPNGFIRQSALTAVSTNCTVVLYYKTADANELWVKGNQNNGIYLSASYGNNYYHNACGSPSNWVDLKQVYNPVTEGCRNDQYHMWEAKGVDFSTWNYFEWFLYPDPWTMTGDVSKIMVYNRSLSAQESAQNFNVLRSRFGI